MHPRGAATAVFHWPNTKVLPTPSANSFAGVTAIPCRGHPQNIDEERDRRRQLDGAGQYHRPIDFLPHIWLDEKEREGVPSSWR
jgi:hypothetical protein